MIILGLEFRMTCGACPEQYDVYRGDEEVGYVRLRHGWLYAQHPFGGDTVFEAEPLDADGIFASQEQRMDYLTQIAAVISERLDEGRPKR